MALQPAQGPGELGRLGQYRVLSVLGEGGMGTVFRAEDTLLRRAVALKVIKVGPLATPAVRERFLREARAMAAVHHDHVVPVWQVGEVETPVGPVPFLAMPLLAGESLSTRLRREGKLPVAEALRVAAETASGLAAAHERGLIHRDIKPDNLWLEAPTGRVKVLDFGLAREVERMDGEHHTVEGAIVGTPAYMAPEQVRGEAVTPRSDLFALGCVLYRCLTGVSPFQGRSIPETFGRVLTEEPKAVCEVEVGVSAGVSALVGRMLAKEAERRPGSAAEVVRALAAESGEPVNEGEPEAVPERAKPKARWGVLVGFWAVAVLALLGGMIVVIVRDKDGREVARVTVPEGGSVTVQPADATSPPTRKTERANPFGLVTAPAHLPGLRTWTIETKWPRQAGFHGGSFAVSPNGEQFACSGGSGAIRLYRLADGEILKVFIGPPEYIWSVGWSADGSQVAAATDKSVHVWDVQTGRRTHHLVGNSTWGGFLAFSPDGKTLALDIRDEGDKRIVRLLDLVGDKPAKDFSVTADLTAAVWLADGKRLAITSWSRLYLIDPVADNPILIEEETNHARDVKRSRDGQTLLVSGHSGLRFLSGDQKINMTWPAAVAKQLPDAKCAWSPDEKSVVVWSGAGGDPAQCRLYVFRAKKAEPEVLAELRGHTVTVLRAFWTPDGKGIVSFGADNTMRRWDAATGKLISSGQFFRPLDKLGVVVSPEGHWRGPAGVEKELVYVVETDQGQETLTPAEFAQRFGWKNDPSKVPSLFD